MKEVSNCVSPGYFFLFFECRLWKFPILFLQRVRDEGRWAVVVVALEIAETCLS